VKEEDRPNRRSVRLSSDESWATVELGHTGIFTTLRRDGVPVPLPVWYVVLERRIYVTTPSAAKKVARIRHDPRASFLVESGERWVELKAVLLTGRAFLVDDDELRERVRRVSDDKYAGYRLQAKMMPNETRERYGRIGALICFEPDERIVSWDNARLFD
jgi:nitroimidazol reductase NimA-like FMN-containing flavoprotein (pyridoxamine 5'-phosphate oxidase superfamily)